MNKNVVRGLLAVSGLACAALSANAQSGAPSSAQVWEVRFLVDSTGDFAAGPNATAVGITMQARVGIRANTTTAGTVNFGVNRVGGLNTTSAPAFLMTFADPLDTAANHGTLARGATGEILNGNPINDSAGNALAGHFANYRTAFAPLGTGGANTDATNGVVGTAANGNQTITNISGSRSSNNTNPGNVGSPSSVGGALGASTVNGDGTLTGDFASVFRFVYFPRFELGVTFPRNITVNVANLGVRYLFRDNGGLFSVSTELRLPNSSFTFQVPGPGAAALVGLGGLVAARRRRA
ncbi:MAG: hypothetical protein ACT4PL_11875 [Phycisphaerales bacterium]